MAPSSSSVDYANMGALPPPPGVIPHFNDFGTQLQAALLVFAIIVITLPTLFVGLRLWTKLRISKDMGWDDYTCFAAHLLWSLQPPLMLVSRRDGFGLHQWDVTVEQSSRDRKLAVAVGAMYGPITALTRISLLLQFLRIFVPMRTPRKLFYFVQCLILFNVLFYTGDVFAVIFQCTPQEKIWRPTIPGYCINKSVTLLRSAVANVFTDIFIAVLPLKIIWALQMPTRRKIAITAVFATGLLACLCAIFRLVAAVVWLNTTDFSYYLAAESFFLASEVVFGLICGCLPILPRFISHYYPKIASIFRSNAASTKRYHPSTIRSHCTYTGKPRTRGPGQSLDVPGGDGSYRELDEFRGLERAHRRVVIIEGGLDRSASTREGWSPDTDSFVDLEIGTPSMAIRKTVRVESIMEV